MPARRRSRSSFSPSLSLLAWATALLPAAAKDISTVPIPSSGRASLTRYDFPLGAYGACGCARNSTYYPTAALSQAAYGSSMAFGPACGQCFNLTLLETFFAEPTWVLSEEQRRSVVVKVTDKCPATSGNPNKGWCGATDKKTNKADLTYHFDLSTPSPSIPLTFFPTNESYYGYSDFGAWIIEFEQVSCEEWAGWGNETAVGRDLDLSSESGCCPANPLIDNDVCPAMSLKASASMSSAPHLTLLLAVALAGAASTFISE
ncbi:hypothetical protein JCM6882_007454 [Rhodosporidiobolus microsporus]